MSFIKWSSKMLVSIFYDILIDNTIGRLPIIGTIADIGAAAMGFLLWGFPGTKQLWEVLDFSDQIDGFVPTLTIIGIFKIKEIWND